MNRRDLETLFGETVRSDEQTASVYERLADVVVEIYDSGDQSFREHLRDRFRRVTESTGQAFDPGRFDLDTARAFIAGEVGFTSWDELADAAENGRPDGPILFRYAVAALWRGDFTSLERTVGGPEAFEYCVADWCEKGYFAHEPEMMAEAFAAACWLGHAKTAAYLLDKGVDPYAGMRTGLSGFHWAASSGRLNVIKLLIDRNVPMEVENMYGGTVFGQAIWSAVNENSPHHAAIVEALVMNGAVVDDSYLEWWNEQEVSDQDSKQRIATVLKEHAEFHTRADEAKKAVTDAESQPSKKALADSLKSLGNILRRPPFTRGAANEAYERAADIYHDLGLTLEEAWVKRHIGINHEYAGRLEDAERMYDEAVALYREHATDDTLDYANAVRYAAVAKNILGKRAESECLWEEAHDRYAKTGPGGLGEGVAEASAWLTIFAIEKCDRALADKWFARANEASAASSDEATHRFIDEVRDRMKPK